MSAIYAHAINLKRYNNLLHSKKKLSIIYGEELFLAYNCLYNL